MKTPRVQPLRARIDRRVARKRAKACFAVRVRADIAQDASPAGWTESVHSAPHPAGDADLNDRDSPRCATPSRITTADSHICILGRAISLHAKAIALDFVACTVGQTDGHEILAP